MKRKKVKVAIFTWFNEQRNCGQTLQAYALQEAVKGLSDERSLYLPLLIRKQFNYSYFHGHGDIKNKLWNYLQRKYRQNIFDLFVRNYLKISRELNSDREVQEFLKSNCVDVLLVGSDQLWNAQGQLESRFFLPYKGDFRKASYATGMMDGNLYQTSRAYRKKYERMISLLNAFDAMSVREEAGKKILQELGYGGVQRVLDPTFLLSCDEWEKIAKGEKGKNRYLLIYFLGKINEEQENFVRRLCAEKNLDEIRYIVTDEEYNVPENWKKRRDVGPAEFVGLIKGASYICTDSFHGMTFSIIFEKNFYVYRAMRKHFAANFCRIQEVLQMLGLEARCSEMDKMEDIDYQPVKERLALEISKSIEYLSGALKENE